MMDPERWKRAMKEAGFRQIVSCPSDLNPVLDVEKHMLVCSKQPETEIELHNRAVQKCWWEGFRPSDSLQALQNDTHRTIEALSKQSVPLATESEEWQIQPAQVESMMQEIWCELLGHKTINVNSSFASLGGESLVTIRMIQVVRRKIVTLPNLGHEMPFIDSKSTVVTDFLQEFVAT
ncbi:unnamed protein product [Rotaria sordida]|uniref:Carrier domain-containing protein n=1 Tax=Rotaria sordida TaxID=392033 RepID=A0A818Z7D2_9BILA|nr:unnamed protein product [Rotaria sordida]